MKQCPECGGYFDDAKYKCPDCDKILENTNDIKVKIASRALKVSLGLAPTVYELILCAFLRQKVYLLFISDFGSLRLLILLWHRQFFSKDLSIRTFHGIVF